MHYIAHRKNTIAELNVTPECYGIEIDLRTQDDQLILNHDPFSPAEKSELFENWLQAFKCKPRGTLILNVKEAGLEDSILDLMEKYNISDFFFLDQPAPYLIWSACVDKAKMARMQKRMAVRVSQYEPVEAAMVFAGKLNWAWIDCFDGVLTLTREEAERLKNARFKLCLVSPELQGQDASKKIPDIFSLMKERHIVMDAICTKDYNVPLWMRLLESR